MIRSHSGAPAGQAQGLANTLAAPRPAPDTPHTGTLPSGRGGDMRIHRPLLTTVVAGLPGGLAACAVPPAPPSAPQQGCTGTTCVSTQALVGGIRDRLDGRVVGY